MGEPGFIGPQGKPGDDDSKGIGGIRGGTGQKGAVGVTGYPGPVHVNNKTKPECGGAATMVVFVMWVFVAWQADCDRLFWP